VALRRRGDQQGVRHRIRGALGHSHREGLDEGKGRLGDGLPSIEPLSREQKRPLTPDMPPCSWRARPTTCLPPNTFGICKEGAKTGVHSPVARDLFAIDVQQCGWVSAFSSPRRRVSRGNRGGGSLARCRSGPAGPCRDKLGRHKDAARRRQCTTASPCLWTQADRFCRPFPGPVDGSSYIPRSKVNPRARNAARVATVSL
jgi:hypothetical protein